MCFCFAVVDTQGTRQAECAWLLALETEVLRQGAQKFKEAVGPLSSCFLVNNLEFLHVHMHMCGHCADIILPAILRC